MKDLIRVKGYGLNEILSNVPGVLAQSRYGNQDVRLTIRGFGARGAGERSNAGTSRGIRILSDGFPETEPDGRTSFDLIDLSGASSVEIVRSNASAIWGNAAGGVVNITSNSSFTQPYIHLQSLFGSFGFVKQNIQFGANLDAGNFFFSLSNTNFDGWREHSNSSQTLLNANITSQLGVRTALGIFLTGTTNIFRIPGPLTQQQFDSNARQAQNDTMNYKPTYVQRDERRSNRSGRLGATVTHDIDDENTISAMAFVNPKFLQRSERNTFRDFTRYHIGGNFIYSNRIEFGSSIKAWTQIGIDEAYQDGAILFYSLIDGHRGDQLKDNKSEGANNFGTFFQEEINIGEHIVTLLGGRYDNITYFYESFINPGLNDTKSFKRFTPKAGVTYRFTPFHSVYLNIGGGVEVPAGNETDPSGTSGQDTITAINPLLEPIKSTTFEIGTKQIISFSKGTDHEDDYCFVQSFDYDIALYWITVNDDIIPYRGGRFYFTAGETRRIGAEVGIGLVTSPGISIQSSFSLSRNKYISYLIDSVHYNKPNAFADLSNNKMAGVPDLFYNISVRYSPTFYKELFAEISLQSVGEYFANDANILSVPAYTLIHGTIGFNDINLWKDKLFLRGVFGINNITNEKYAASAFINPDYDRNNNQAIYLEPGLPRNIFSSVSVNFRY